MLIIRCKENSNNKQDNKKVKMKMTILIQMQVLIQVLAFYRKHLSLVKKNNKMIECFKNIYKYLFYINI